MASYPQLIFTITRMAALKLIYWLIYFRKLKIVKGEFLGTDTKGVIDLVEWKLFRRKWVLPIWICCADTHSCTHLYSIILNLCQHSFMYTFIFNNIQFMITLMYTFIHNNIQFVILICSVHIHIDQRSILYADTLSCTRLYTIIFSFYVDIYSYTRLYTITFKFHCFTVHFNSLYII
jgi:hypothetical protein